MGMDLEGAGLCLNAKAFRISRRGRRGGVQKCVYVRACACARVRAWGMNTCWLEAWILLWEQKPAATFGLTGKV